MSLFKSVNLALRFLLELGILAGLGYWGFWAGKTLPDRLLLGIGVPLAAALLWGLFLAPAATWRLDDPIRSLVELVLFGGAALAVYKTGQTTPGVVFFALFLLNKVLLLLWRQ